MKFEIRNIDGIRNLNYNKGNNEIYFLKTQPDGKKEKFKIADAVLEDNKLIYRFIENNKTSLILNDLKLKLKIWKFLEHPDLKVEKETTLMMSNPRELLEIADEVIKEIKK